MSQKHGNGNSIQPEYDIATRHEVVGGANHGNLYGFGKENPKNILGTPEMGHASGSGHGAHSTQNISDIVQQVMAQVVMHLDVAVQRSVNNALINVGIQPSHQAASRGDAGVVNNNAGGEGNNARSAADGSRI
ncbi:hypothetical protein CCACVL1_25010 [Corchorus capsularis]|uniref:Uncharacterized protein n=1 Tax=Corchorus capsularis TaxID=210143 RepID=A0A1R3GM92_COCAP|nr:hypothetical protein CCACVL1_25010 [Corchorus capsularis]